MNMQEYQTIKDFTYLEYCNYLQNKYGLCPKPYMTKSFNKTVGNSRTKEGLVIHHKCEDMAILLSTQEIASLLPMEMQLPENLVYCDYLEHLYLHTLICKYPSPNKIPQMDVGIGGILAYIAPELNDVYSGYRTGLTWRQNCYDVIINDKDVYLEIIKSLLEIRDDLVPHNLCTSYHAQHNTWNETLNQKIYDEIAPKTKRKKRWGIL